MNIPKLYKKLYMSGFKSHLDKCQASFDCSDIYEMIMNHSIVDTCINPPYPMFWVELKWPIDVNLGKVFGNGRIHHTVGFFVQATEEKGVGCEYSIKPVSEFERISNIDFGYCDILFKTDNNGNLEKEQNGLYKMYLSDKFQKMEDIDENIVNEFSGMVKLICGICCFMSAKNITVNENKIELSQKEKRILKRNNHKPEIKYHTLIVHSVGNRKENIECEIANKNIMPLHLCRGHLRTYTDEKPLFGIYSGTYFIHAHVRGRLDNGAVLKNYKLVS